MSHDGRYASWIDVYEAHKNKLFVVAMALTGRRELAEDAVHDAFAELYAQRPHARNAKAYAFQAVRNSARMILRSRGRAGGPGSATALPSDVVGEVDPAAVYVQRGEAAKSLRQALGELSKAQHEVIVMHVHADLTFQEIATVVGRPLGTVVSQYRRGIEKLRQSLNVADLSEVV